MSTPMNESIVIAERPTPGQPREYHFPRFERHRLTNGLQLLVAPVHNLPLVSVLALVDAGATCDPAGQEGIATLTAKALLEGAAGYDADALSARFEMTGTSIDASADWDATIVSMNALAHVFPSALKNFATVLTAPTFPEHAVERLKGERIAEILHTESEPRELANEQFERFVYTDASRYHHPLDGTKTSVNTMHRDAVAAFYSDRFRPGNTTLIIAGDITASAALQLVESTLGSWSGDASARIVANDTPRHAEPHVHIVHRPNAPQSELRVGHVGAPRTVQDYFPITVMNAILGGLFGSRINLNLREKHGYTYGARSTYDWRREAGPFCISTAVASNVTDASIWEILAEVTQMRTEPVSASELSLATDYLDGVFPIRFETTSAVASALASLVMYGLPDTWHDEYRANIRKVTQDDVLSAAQQYVNPEHLQFVVIGDASIIEEPLTKLKVGPVTVHKDISA